MSSMSPLLLALIVTVVVAGIGALIALHRRRRTFADYEDISQHAEQIRKLLKGTLAREGDDLVITGIQGMYPASVRFSHAENTPGLYLRMEAPSNFTFSAVARGEKAAPGRIPIRTGDDKFDSRFVSRSDHPTQARLFLGSKTNLLNIQKLCCSSKSAFVIGTGFLEQSEQLIPEGNLGVHAADHIRQMRTLAENMSLMPGAEQVKISRRAQNRRILARTAIAAGAIAAIAALWMESRRPAEANSPTTQVLATVPQGMAAADAARIPSLQGYRLATSADYDEKFASWMRNFSIEPAGRYELNLSGPSYRDSNDVAYLLVRDDEKRVVVISNGAILYDATVPKLEGLAPVPQESLSNVEWSEAGSATPAGGGLLFVQTGEQNSSFIFAHEGKFASSGIRDYQRIRLR